MSRDKLGVLGTANTPIRASPLEDGLLEVSELACYGWCSYGLLLQIPSVDAGVHHNRVCLMDNKMWLHRA